MTQVQHKHQQQQNSSQFKMVPLPDLNVDPEAQRALVPGWVKAHVPKFDVDQLGYIVVNKRSNGKLYIVDGQHRVELMRAVGWGDQAIHAEMFSGLTQAQEAELFLARNDRRAVSRYAKFRVAVTAGDPMAVDIDRIVRAHGLVVSDQSRDGHVVAVDALERVYQGGGIASAKDGAAALGKALTVAVQAWGNQPSSVNGRVIHAIGLIFLRYGSTIDDKDLIRKLAPFPGGAPGILGKGRSSQEIRGRPLHHCIASILVDLYNKGRRVGKIDAWEE